MILTRKNNYTGITIFNPKLDDLNRAPFFGEETGGCIYGLNSDDYLNLTLPNTPIKVTIPIRIGINNISVNSNLNRGVIPDYKKVRNSNSDILEAKDTELE